MHCWDNQNNSNTTAVEVGYIVVCFLPAGRCLPFVVGTRTGAGANCANVARAATAAATAAPCSSNGNNDNDDNDDDE